MKIYLVRHAKPAIASNIFYGQMDVPLSEEGKAQARITGKILGRVDFTRIISSDLSRCVETAMIIKEVMGLKTEIETTPMLREVDFGDWTGLGWEQIEERYPGAFEQRMLNLANFRPPNGETLLEAHKRAWQVLEEVKQQGLENVLIVGHGGINRLCLAHGIGLPLQYIFNLGQDYGCINILECYDDNRMNLLILNLCPSTQGF